MAQFFGAIRWRHSPTLDVRPSRRYAPHFYVEEFALLSKHARPLSSDVTRPHPNITVRVTPVGLGRFRLMQQVSMTFQVLQEMLGMGPEEFEEVRELLLLACTPRNSIYTARNSAVHRCASCCRPIGSTASC